MARAIAILANTLTATKAMRTRITGFAIETSVTGCGLGGVGKTSSSQIEPSERTELFVVAGAGDATSCFELFLRGLRVRTAVAVDMWDTWKDVGDLECCAYILFATDFWGWV